MTYPGPGFRTTGGGSFHDVEAEVERSKSYGGATPRWDGDPKPEAYLAHVRAKAEAGNAWQAVAETAQINANGVRIDHRHRTPGSEIIRLVAVAEGLSATAMTTLGAYRRAEETYKPREQVRRS